MCSVVVACLHLPAFPLQLVWRHEPALRGQAVVIVDCDEPRGRVLWACERARKRGIAVGMRYAQAIGLCDTLQARVVGNAMLDAATAELQLALAKLSPRVDLDEDRAGTCWLDGDGLDRLFPRASWAQTIARTIQGLAYRGVVVVGGSKFATYAVARAQRKPEVIVFRGDADERTAAARVKLDVLDIAPELEVALARLGVATVGQLVRLPAGGILERFGGDAHRLYQLAAGERWDPIVPVALPDTPVERVELDDDDDDLDRLAFAIKAAIDRLLGRLAARVRACAVLHVELACRTTLAETQQQAHCIKSALPTLDAALLLRLVRLRLTGARRRPRRSTSCGCGPTTSPRRASSSRCSPSTRAAIRAPPTRRSRGCAPSSATTRSCARCCATVTCPRRASAGSASTGSCRRRRRRGWSRR